MDAPHLVKVSVFLPESLHFDLKRQAMDQRTSLQKVIAEKVASEGTVAESNETLESLSIGTGSQEISRRTIKKWQSRLERVLVSGNRLAILNATATIEAMEALINARISPTVEQLSVGLNGRAPMPS